jgi:two-component system sensor histidine kinase/response regulator
LRILLAEDNELNRRLATILLERAGHQVVCAGDGQAALDLLEQEDCDLVFMDVQMPQMDGLEATGKIRQFERDNPEGHKVLIIALTARTMPGDRERCLDSGMDDFLSKPVRTEALQGIIETWGAKLKAQESSGETPPSVPGSTPASQPFPASPPTSVEIDPRVDLERLSEFSGGDQANMRELVHLYLTQTQGSLAKLKTSINAGTIAEVQQLAHKTCGASATCGMMRISKPLKELEMQAIAGKLTDAHRLFQQIETDFAELRNFLASQNLVT